MATTDMKDQAQQVLFDQVFIPAFINKLAELNIAPQSEADLQEMLKLAAKLEQVELSGATQHPALRDEADPFLKQASQNLDRLMGSTQQPAGVPDVLRKAASVLLTPSDTPAEQPAAAQ
jgi:hypothetical protein